MKHTRRGPAGAGVGFIVTVFPAALSLLTLLRIAYRPAVGAAGLADLYVFVIAMLVVIPASALAVVFGFLYFRPSNRPNARAAIARRRAERTLHSGHESSR